MVGRVGVGSCSQEEREARMRRVGQNCIYTYIYTV